MIADGLRESATPSDQERARKMLEMTCAQEAGCEKLADVLYEGVGGPADPARAFSLLEAECKRNISACVRVVDAVDRGRGTAIDPQRAAALHRDLVARCRQECETMARAYTRGFDGVAKNIGRAMELFDAACRGDDFHGCFEEARVDRDGSDPPGKPADPARAATLFERACNTSWFYSCVDLGMLYDKGLGVVGDPRRALELFEKGCKEASYHSECRRLVEAGVVLE